MESAMPDPIPAEIDAPVAVDEAVLDENGRPAGRRELAVLVAASCLPVLGAVLIAPVLPKVRDAFAGPSGVEALPQISLTVPALFIGLLALFAGRVADAV